MQWLYIFALCLLALLMTTKIFILIMFVWGVLCWFLWALLVCDGFLYRLLVHDDFLCDGFWCRLLVCDGFLYRWLICDGFLCIFLVCYGFLCVLLLLKSFLVWKGVMCMFGGRVKMCEFCGCASRNLKVCKRKNVPGYPISHYLISEKKRKKLIRWHYYNMTRFNKYCIPIGAIIKHCFLCKRTINFTSYNLLTKILKLFFHIATMKMLTKII